MPKIIRFSLEMENGAKVRSIEELRENADVSSIVKYFLNGQLKRWCRAFGYEELSEALQGINGEIIRKIYDILGIPLDNEAITKYSEENIPNSISSKVVCDEPEEAEVVNNEDIRNTLRDYVDKEIVLEDYAVEIFPIQNEMDKITKNKITISNSKTEQYSSFFIPYYVGECCTKNIYYDDTYQKIAFVINKMYYENNYFQIKNLKYANLDLNNTFEFGHFDGKSINWLVLKKDGNSLLAITTSSICHRRFDEKSNDWSNSELRNWLNNEFYRQAFTEDEISTIGINGQDKVTILAKEEVTNLMSETQRKGADCWWIKTIVCSVTNYHVMYVSNLGIIQPYGDSVRNPSLGIRPVIKILF